MHSRNSRVKNLLITLSGWLLLLCCFIQSQACAETIATKKIPTSIISKEESVIFRFEQTESVEMASVFLDGKWLIIFNQPVDIELPNSNPLFKSLFETFDVVTKNSKYTLVVVKFAQDITPKIQKIDQDWCFELSALEKKKSIPKKHPIAIKKGNKWPEITIHNVQSKKGIFVKYDEYDIFVIPTSSVDGGLQILYKTPFYELLNTTQGFACLSLSPYTFFEPTGDFYLVKIARDIPLKRDITLKENISPTFMLAPSTEQSVEEVRKLEDKIIAKRSIQDQFKLVLHYIAQGNGEKALSILNAAITYAPALEFNTTTQRLTCLAYLLKRKPAKCLERSETISTSLETEIWKQIANTRVYRTTFLFSMRQFIEAIIKNYPPFLVKQLLPEILEMANNFDEEDFISQLTQSKFFPQEDYFQLIQRFYEAERMRKNGEKNTALKLYERVAEYQKTEAFSITMYQAWASFQLILEQLNTKGSISDNIEKLKKLRSLWKGDYLEYLILKKIAELYDILKNPEESLKYMTLAKDSVTSPPQKILIENKIKKILKAYFAERADKPGKAVEIISTYETHQAMFADETSTDIMNLIIKSFLELDLLDQASDFLARSCAKMPDNIQKHKLQIEAARIYVLNKKYQAALALLDSMSELISPAIQQQKTLLKADALRYSGKLDESLTLLRSSSDPVVLRKVADILIEEKNWEEASKSLNILVGLIDETKNPVEKKQAIIDLAVILKSQNNITELEILKKTYENFMKDDSFFTMLTEKENSSPKNREELENTFKEIKKFTDLVKKIQ